MHRPRSQAIALFLGCLALFVAGNGLIMVIGAIGVLPAVPAALYARRRPAALGLTFAADVAIGLGYMAWTVISAVGRFDAYALIAMPALAGGFFVTLTGLMLIARRCGYRLLCGRH